jgi:APA family basic amino acid/polyamine antiporter
MQLKPVLGQIQLTFYGIGVIVGAGAYTIIGAAAALAGPNLWLCFLAGALVALLTALSYAEMATAFPGAGAEYVYMRLAFPRRPWVSFTVGLIILIGGSATAATVAVAFGGYFKTFIDLPIVLSALALLVACTLFNIWGLHESSWLNIAFTLIEVGGIVLVILAGLTRDDFAAPLAVIDIQPGFMAATALLFFVYLGFEEIANLSEEVRDPGRNMPRAIFWSLGITTCLYVMTALAVLALATPHELAGSEAPLSLAVQKVWPGAGYVLGGIALFAAANTVLITVIATSRLAFSMARDNEIPPLFSRLLPGRGTPWVAALLTLLVAAALTPAGGVELLAGLSSFAALLAFLAVNVGLIVLRYRDPDRLRPFRVPMRIGRLPVLPVAGIATILALLAYFDWRIYVAGLGAFVFGVIALGVRRWLRR